MSAQMDSNDTNAHRCRAPVEVADRRARQGPKLAVWLPRGQTSFDATGVMTVFLCLVLFIPARWVLPGFGAAGRPANLFAIGMFALWLAVKVLPDVHSRSTFLRWPLLLYVCAMVTSYGFGYDRGLDTAGALAADRALMDVVALAGVLLITSEGLPTMAQANRLTKRFVNLTALVAAIAVFQFVTQVDPYAYIRFPGLTLNSELSDLGLRGQGTLVRVRGSTDHPIEFAVLMAMAFPIAIHHALHEADRIRQRRGFAIVALLGGAAALAVSRSAVVAMAASGITLLWVWSASIRIKALVVGILGLAVLRVAVPGLLGTIRSLFENLGTDNSISGRTEDYELVAAAAADRPYFGRGLGNSLSIVLDNAYLRQLVTTGYIGLASLLILLLSGLVLGRRGLKGLPSNEARHLAAALLGAMWAAVVSAGTFSFFFFPAASAALLLAVAVAAALTALPTSAFDGLALPLSPILRPFYRVETPPASLLARIRRGFKNLGVYNRQLRASSSPHAEL